MMQNIRPEARESYTYEYRADGETIVWRFKNAVSPQEVLEDVQTAATWLWSFKDHVKEWLPCDRRDHGTLECRVERSSNLGKRGR